MKTIYINDCEEVCSNCKHFHQHYGCGDGRICYPLNCGHCHYPRIKHRKPYQTCERWEVREEADAA